MLTFFTNVLTGCMRKLNQMAIHYTAKLDPNKTGIFFNTLNIINNYIDFNNIENFKTGGRTPKQFFIDFFSLERLNFHPEVKNKYEYFTEEEKANSYIYKNKNITFPNIELNDNEHNLLRKLGVYMFLSIMKYIGNNITDQNYKNYINSYFENKINVSFINKNIDNNLVKINFPNIVILKEFIDSKPTNFTDFTYDSYYQYLHNNMFLEIYAENKKLNIKFINKNKENILTLMKLCVKKANKNINLEYQINTINEQQIFNIVSPLDIIYKRIKDYNPNTSKAFSDTTSPSPFSGGTLSPYNARQPGTTPKPKPVENAQEPYFKVEASPDQQEITLDFQQKLGEKIVTSSYITRLQEEQTYINDENTKILTMLAKKNIHTNGEKSDVIAKLGNLSEVKKYVLYF